MRSRGMTLQDDVADPGPAEQMGKHEPRRPGADDADLRALHGTYSAGTGAGCPDRSAGRRTAAATTTTAAAAST